MASTRQPARVGYERPPTGGAPMVLEPQGTQNRAPSPYPAAATPVALAPLGAVHPRAGSDIAIGRRRRRWMILLMIGLGIAAMAAAYFWPGEL
jgi:hypothetical protein